MTGDRRRTPRATPDRRQRDIRELPNGAVCDFDTLRWYLDGVDRRAQPPVIERLSIRDPFCIAVEQQSRAPRAGHPDLAGARDGAASRDEGALLEAFGTRASASGSAVLPPTAEPTPLT